MFSHVTTMYFKNGQRQNNLYVYERRNTCSFINNISNNSLLTLCRRPNLNCRSSPLTLTDCLAIPSISLRRQAGFLFVYPTPGSPTKNIRRHIADLGRQTKPGAATLYLTHTNIMRMNYPLSSCKEATTLRCGPPPRDPLSVGSYNFPRLASLWMFFASFVFAFRSHPMRPSTWRPECVLVRALTRAHTKEGGHIHYIHMETICDSQRQRVPAIRCLTRMCI